MNEQPELRRLQLARARRRIARMKDPEVRAMAYFIEEMKDTDWARVRAALSYLANRYYRHGGTP